MDLLSVLLCSNVQMDTAKIVMASFFCSNEAIKDISVLHQKNDDIYDFFLSASSHLIPMRYCQLIPTER